MRGSKREWIFRVQVSNLEKNECVYVVGSIPKLGAWNHNQAIQLFQEHTGLSKAAMQSSPPNENNADREFCTKDTHTEAGDTFLNDAEKKQILSQKVSLPIDMDIEYRYFIAVICQSSGARTLARSLIIRRWETHMIPRKINKNVKSNFVNDSLPDPEIFGSYNSYKKVERGWLTEETVIQFKLFNNPIKLWKSRLQNKSVNIKMTPVNLVRHNSLELQQMGNDGLDDSLSLDTQDIVDQPAFSITEIAVMNIEEAHFKYQEQFGRPYKEDEFILFNVAVRNLDTILLPSLETASEHARSGLDRRHPSSAYTKQDLWCK